jgi:hypothetical protein
MMAFLAQSFFVVNSRQNYPEYSILACLKPRIISTWAFGLPKIAIAPADAGLLAVPPEAECRPGNPTGDVDT